MTETAEKTLSPEELEAQAYQKQQEERFGAPKTAQPPPPTDPDPTPAMAEPEMEEQEKPRAYLEWKSRRANREELRQQLEAERAKNQHMQQFWRDVEDLAKSGQQPAPQPPDPNDDPGGFIRFQVGQENQPIREFIAEERQRREQWAAQQAYQQQVEAFQRQQMAMIEEYTSSDVGKTFPADFERWSDGFIGEYKDAGYSEQQARFELQQQIALWSNQARASGNEVPGYLHWRIAQQGRHYAPPAGNGAPPPTGKSKVKQEVEQLVKAGKAGRNGGAGAVGDGDGVLDLKKVVESGQMSKARLESLTRSRYGKVTSSTLQQMIGDLLREGVAG